MTLVRLSPLLSVTPPIFSIETLMAWQRFEIIQLFLNTKFPPWLDNNWQARPQHVPVGPRQLQSQGGALDPGDLRHQHPRHQETRPAGGARHHQDPGGQGAVQISIKSIKQISLLITIILISSLYDIWPKLQTINTVYTVKLRLGCEMELSLYPHDVQVLELEIWKYFSFSPSGVKIFSMTFICLFLLPHRSATSDADFIFAT